MPLIEQRKNLSALILGSGGASKAVQYALSELDIAYKVVSRNRKNGFFTYPQINDRLIKTHLLIINTTPLGMYPNTNASPAIPYEHLTSQHICYDLIYNPNRTEFLDRCEHQGAIIKNGMEMLYLQAELSWEIWQNDEL